ncbi:MAG TPA: protein kinase [Gemmataceae bacterium]|jgi:serine/threonine-protein kinase|nr:protein kinase [Gemmataceae bacterium]
MSDCPDKEKLHQLLDERLPEAEYREIEGHVQTCARCQQALDSLRALPTQVQAAIGQPEPSTYDQLEEWVDPAAVPVPDVPGYEILGVIGKGGMGVVYKARQKSLNRPVALKMILGTRTEPAYRERFLSEARLAASLQHPHILQVFDFGEQDGQPFFSQELAEGGSLADRLRQDGVWPARKAAELVARLAGAAEYAHRTGIIHRDLTPGNILLTADGSPKIADFGLAKKLNGAGGRTVSGAVLGNPAYMSKEQADGEAAHATPATDVFGLGAILYHLLTGRPPYQADTQSETIRQARECRPDRPRTLNRRVPRALERICLKAMAEDPGERYPSSGELEKHLRGFLNRPKRLAQLAAALAALLLVGVTLGALLLPRTAPPANPRPMLQDERLVLRIWSKDGSKKGLRIGLDPGGLPARPGDQIRAEVRLNQPAHIYLLALDGQGQVTPLYPWHRDVRTLDRTLRDPPPVVPPQAELIWPSLESTQGLPLDDRDGLETILLLARGTPLPAADSLADLVGPLPLPATPLGHAEEFVLRGGDPGRPEEALRIDAHRGFQKQLTHIDEPLDKLLGRLGKEFELLRAVRFAHQGR